MARTRHMTVDAPGSFLSDLIGKLARLPGARKMLGDSTQISRLPPDLILDMASQLGLIALPPPLPRKALEIVAMEDRSVPHACPIKQNDTLPILPTWPRWRMRD